MWNFFRVHPDNNDTFFVFLTFEGSVQTHRDNNDMIFVPLLQELKRRPQLYWKRKRMRYITYCCINYFVKIFYCMHLYKNTFITCIYIYYMHLYRNTFFIKKNIFLLFDVYPFSPPKIFHFSFPLPLSLFPHFITKMHFLNYRHIC